MLKTNRRAFPLLLTTLVLAAAGPASADGPTSRPADPWVFRSVLDNHPRMITVALHENLWLAFDAQSCSWRKAWKGGVKFTGSVYDTKHGPQPQSVGETYFSSTGPTVALKKGDESVDVKCLYRGYAFVAGRVVLKYDVTADGLTVAVEESPEYDLGSTHFVRTIKVSGLKAGYALELTQPSTSEDVTTDTDGRTGEPKLLSDSPQRRLRFERDADMSIEIKLEIKSGGGN